MQITAERVEAARQYLSPEQQAELDSLLVIPDPAPIVLLSDLKIRTKDKRLVPLRPNDVQEMYLDILTEQYASFDWRRQKYDLKGAREDILKARQEGLSTLWLALYFLDTINTPLTQTLIIAHDAETTEKLFKIIHRFYENLPREKRRPKKYSSKREIEFSDIDSIIAVGTAGGKGVGRGGTVNNIHESERAFWERGDVLETGLLESLAPDGNVTRETTANGLNEYYEEYQRSKRGESRFRARFFGWNLQHEYRISGVGGMVSDVIPTAEESVLRSSYGLDDAQLRWRREKIKDLKTKFPQEYPINDIEAFLASGNPRFNRDFLYRLLQGLDTVAERIETPDNSEWSGTVTTYLEPEEDRKYLITADVSEGLNADGKHDNSVAHVYDRETWEQVAHYVSGIAEPHDYGLDLATLGRLYNTAVICVERNNPGHSVLNTLENTCNYPSIYAHIAYDEEMKPTLPRNGFPTTTRTKPEACGDLASIIEEMNDGNVGFLWNHPKTIEELIHFVKKEGKKMEAESGSNDDEVSCCWMAAALMADYIIKPRPINRFPTVAKTRYGNTSRIRR